MDWAQSEDEKMLLAETAASSNTVIPVFWELLNIRNFIGIPALCITPGTVMRVPGDY